MVTNSPIRLTEDERLHQYVMHNIVKQIQSTSYILKGGTALILTRGLPRYSVDLDFDSERKLDIEHHIRKGLKSAGVEIISLSTSKNTDTVRNYSGITSKATLKNVDKRIFLLQG